MTRVEAEIAKIRDNSSTYSQVLNEAIVKLGKRPSHVVDILKQNKSSNVISNSEEDLISPGMMGVIASI